MRTTTLTALSLLPLLATGCTLGNMDRDYQPPDWGAPYGPPGADAPLPVGSPGWGAPYDVPGADAPFPVGSPGPTFPAAEVMPEACRPSDEVWQRMSQLHDENEQSVHELIR